MSDQEQVLRDHPKFQYMPIKIKEWILASPHATEVFAEFFNQGGVIQTDPEVKLGFYSPEPRPTIKVNEAQ